MGLPWWSSGKDSASQSRGRGFDPWSGKIPHATGRAQCMSLCSRARAPQQETPPSKKPERHSRASHAHCSRRRPTCSSQDPARPKRKKEKFKDSFSAHGGLLRAVTPPKSPFPHPSLPNGLLWVSSLGTRCQRKREREGQAGAGRALQSIQSLTWDPGPCLPALAAATDPQTTRVRLGPSSPPRPCNVLCWPCWSPPPRAGQRGPGRDTGSPSEWT